MPVKKNKDSGEDKIKRGKQAALNLLEDLEAEKDKFAEAKAKDEAMIACIGDGVVAMGLDKKILVMNEAAKNLLRCADREVVGKPYSDFWSAADAAGLMLPEYRVYDQKLLESGQVIKENSFFYVPKNGGQRFPVALTIAPIKLKGRVIGTIEVFRDITHEKELDKAKTEFVSLAAHQLRTPLTSISWYAEMLLADYAANLSDKQKKYLEEVYKGNKRMVVLVNALLNVSRLELGTFAVKPEPTDVVKLAQKVIGEFKLQIDLKKLKFDRQNGQDLPLLNVDPDFLDIVLQNLLSNAIKYTPEKGSVSIDLQFVKRGGLFGNKKLQENSIAIIVSDTGFGIIKEQQDKIFTKLFRGDNVREKDTDGTGLGLYIVKSIVENSGGKIWFESEENKGTTFYVTLPLKGLKKIDKNND